MEHTEALSQFVTKFQQWVHAWANRFAVAFGLSLMMTSVEQQVSECVTVLDITWVTERDSENRNAV